MKIFLLFTLITQFLFSQELILDDLLKEYENSESLYKKTKQESAGFLIVYSRVDLEKMQAFHLRDVLKTIRMYTMQISPTGSIGILNSGAGKTSISPIKLYIDDFEISTVVQKNALDMYADMDIYFVDHIEIYQGGSSIKFGNEPGSMVIRLYSKDPARENSSSAQVSADSKGGGSISAIDAGTMNEYKYLIYANSEKLSYDTYDRNGQRLSRDGKKYQAHFKISKDDDFLIAADGIITKTDIFNGFGTALSDGRLTRAFGYINAIKYLPNNLEISLGASQEIKEAYNSDENGIRLIDNTLIYDTHLNVHSNTYKAAVKKKFITSNNDILIGAEIQRKVFHVYNYDNLASVNLIGPDKLDIYSVYLEELYNINKNNLLSFSAKLDRYEDNFNKTSTEYSLRLGYIGLLTEEWSTKLFAIRRYVYPSIQQTAFTPPMYEANPDLDSTTIEMLSSEIEYKTKKNRLVFGFAYKEIDDALYLDKVAKMYMNKNSTVYFNRYYIRAEHYFNLDNKIIVEGFKAFKAEYGSPVSGVLVQVFNTIAKFDIYNELVYREGLTLNYGLGDFKIDSGYDYTLSVAYSINKHIKLKAKGENLLNKAIKTPIDLQGLVQVSAIERRGILTLEYTF